MNIPTEKYIETCVLNRSDLTEQEIQWVESWIQKDEGLRLLADWFDRFYKELFRMESTQERSNYFSHRIHLKTSQKSSHYSSSAFVLATQTSVAARRSKTLETIRTFVSEEHKTLVRILHNNTKKQSQIHVISNTLHDDDIVLIDVMNDENSTLVSEPGGTFVIPDKGISEDSLKKWETCTLHLPLARINIFKDNDQDTIIYEPSEVSLSRENIQLNWEDDEMEVTIDPSAERIPKKIVFNNEDTSSIWSVENGKCTISLHNYSVSNSTLFFYY